MKLNYKRTVLVGLAFMSISAFWQMYDGELPLILTNPNTFNLGDTWTGVIMALDNVLAIFLLPFFGNLSDKANTRIGKRMPFIIFGTVVAAFMLMALNIADRAVNLPFFIAILFVLLLAMAVYRSPAVALMPDLTPNHLRSKGNAVINLLGAVGGAYSLVMVMLFSESPSPENPHPDHFMLFASIIIVMVVAVAILFLTIKEKKVAHIVHEEITAYERESGEKLEVNIAPDEEEEETNLKKIFSGGLFVGLDAPVKRSMIYLLASIFLWFTAYNAVTTAFSRYARNVWLIEGGGYAQMLMVAMVTAIIAFIPIGNVASRVGRKKTILFGLILMTVCYGMAALLAAPHPVMYVLFALIGVGWASINVNSYPMVVEMSKGFNIGKFTGTYYIFSMSAQVLTPILSGFLLEHVSYRTLFPYAVVFSILAFCTMSQVRHGDNLAFKKGK